MHARNNRACLLRPACASETPAFGGGGGGGWWRVARGAGGGGGDVWGMVGVSGRREDSKGEGSKHCWCAGANRSSRLTKQPTDPVMQQPDSDHLGLNVAILIQSGHQILPRPDGIVYVGWPDWLG